MKILNIILFYLVYTIFFQGCASKNSPTAGPAVQDNSDIRTIEVGLVKEGDKKIKVQALLGTPSEETNTQDGSTMTWWFLPTDYQKNSYKTLKEKPQNLEGVKYIKLTFDGKGILKKKEFDM
ncbi:MAG: hypothetical protein K8R21_01860 [Leptospira sp.]|nr:hypothetical protein [Leptospira sp.]